MPRYYSDRGKNTNDPPVPLKVPTNGQMMRPLQNGFVTSSCLGYPLIQMADVLEQTALLDRLTAKQKEVLGYIADGLTSKEIGRNLGISESAVNQRIETIRQRLGGMPRAQIARLYRRQSTLMITIPTSKSLTGKTIQLQAGREQAQAWSSEGVVDLAAPDAGEVNDRLQPSTFFSIWNGPGAIWVRLGAIVAMAFAMIAAGVLLLDLIDKLARLLKPIA